MTEGEPNIDCYLGVKTGEWAFYLIQFDFWQHTDLMIQTADLMQNNCRSRVRDAELANLSLPGDHCPSH